jgi:hypothetical protein
MDCPHTHMWYELERGALPREDVDRLRRHVAECHACQARAVSVREVAAGLEQLAGCLRHDLAAEANKSLVRRARMRGQMGRPPKLPLVLRLQRSRRLKRGIAASLAAAAVVAAAVVGLWIHRAAEPSMKGSLQQLVKVSVQPDKQDAFAAIAKTAAAAVSEELARPSPSLEQVGDLLMVTYIAQHPKERRQIEDIRFLADGACSRRLGLQDEVAVIGRWPMIASVALAQAQPEAALAEAEDKTSAARRFILAGHYEKALEALPPGDSAAALRAWCLVSLDRLTEASQVLSAAEGRSGGAVISVMRADVALRSGDLAGALKRYDALAESNDRFWFTAGYICRYELSDARSAGKRFERVKDRALAAYVAQKFPGELAAAKDEQPMPLLAEHFANYDLGPLTDWALVQTRGSEFQIVATPHGKTLQQDEVNFRGAEFLTGDDAWSDYTLQTDVRVAVSHGNYTIGAAAYRRADHTGYVLELSPDSLRLVKQFSERTRGRQTKTAASGRMELKPLQAQMRLDQSPAVGWTYTMKIRVQRADGGVNVAGKVWRTDVQEPLGWQVAWTDPGQGDIAPLVGGAAGVQISGAKIQVDNFIILRNESAGEPVVAVKQK